MTLLLLLSGAGETAVKGRAKNAVYVPIADNAAYMLRRDNVVYVRKADDTGMGDDDE